MTRYITVDVTQDHIDRGNPCNPWSCPITLALEDAGQRSPHVMFSVWKSAPSWRKARLTKKAQDFIDHFDRRQPVKPLRLRLPLP